MNIEETTDLYQKESFIKSNKRNILNTAAALLGGSALIWAMEKSTDSTVEYPKPTILAAENSENIGSLETSHKIHLTNGLCITPNDDIKIAKAITSNSFDEAFNLAREQTGPGGLFVWNDKIYNTYQKDEWQSLSLTQRQEFLKDCGYKIETKTDIVNQHQAEPVFIETFDNNGCPIISVDKNADGIVDYILKEDSKGNHFFLIDSTNDNTLDSIYQYWPNSDRQPELIDTFPPKLVSTNEMQIEKEQQIESSILREYEKAEAAFIMAEARETVADDTTQMTTNHADEPSDNFDPDLDPFDNTEDNNYNNNVKMDEFDNSDFE